MSRYEEEETQGDNNEFEGRNETCKGHTEA
jgi:hypothetical protein